MQKTLRDWLIEQGADFDSLIMAIFTSYDEPPLYVPVYEHRVPIQDTGFVQIPEVWGSVERVLKDLLDMTETEYSDPTMMPAFHAKDNSGNVFYRHIRGGTLYMEKAFPTGQSEPLIIPLDTKFL